MSHTERSEEAALHSSSGGGERTVVQENGEVRPSPTRKGQASLLERRVRLLVQRLPAGHDAGVAKHVEGQMTCVDRRRNSSARLGWDWRVGNGERIACNAKVGSHWEFACALR